MKFESRFLAAALVLLLVPAAVWSTTTTAKHRPASKANRVSRARAHARKYLPRFSRVRRRIPLRRSSSRRRTVASSRSRGSSAAHRSRRHTRSSRASSLRHSTAHQVQIQPERAGQIQQALIQAGDLHGQPTDHWDAQTRAAMKLYQQQNGFKPTGLPDAKSLMKMGLGPHPLPLQADPLARAAQAAQPARVGQAGSSYAPPQSSQSSEQANAASPVPERNADAGPEQFPPQ